MVTTSGNLGTSPVLTGFPYHSFIVRLAIRHELGGAKTGSLARSYRETNQRHHKNAGLDETHQDVRLSRHSVR